MPSTCIAINGKFYCTALEGMPRVGSEVVQSIDKLLEDKKWSNLEVRLIVPKWLDELPKFKNITVQRFGRSRGFLWEQIDFPKAKGGDLGLNFTGTAPLVTTQSAAVVHDAQSITASCSFSLKSILLYRVFAKIALHRQKKLITVSNSAKKDIEDAGYIRGRHLEVIYNGCDHIGRTAPDNRILDRFSLEANSYVLTNSYFYPHKNVEQIFRALNILNRPDIKLVLFGTHKEEDYLERNITISTNYLFTGRISDGELVSLLKNARFFAFPSKTEGFGLPPLEAMYLGTPTICSEANAMMELCMGGAMFADKDDPKDWAAKIAALWDNEELRSNLSSKGRAVASLYTWDNAAESYLEFLTSN